MANAEYYAQTGDTVRIERARRAYEMVYKLNHGLIQDPTGLGPKTIPETRRSQAFGDPMIYLNVTNIMRRCDRSARELYDSRAQECVEEILKYHYKPELKCVLETVGVDGSSRPTPPVYRVVNPGHDIEGSWFLQEQANLTGDASLSQTAQTIFFNAIEAGWDQEYGGLLYFIDCMGCPPEAYEHDMKLWWPPQRDPDRLHDVLPGHRGRAVSGLVLPHRRLCQGPLRRPGVRRVVRLPPPGGGCPPCPPAKAAPSKGPSMCPAA